MKNWQKLANDAAFRARMEKRSRIINAIRAFFNERGFLEVETPLVVAQPGLEPYLEPFDTTVISHERIQYPAHLITSPEYAMKKLLAGGLERIYCLGKVFRNGEPFGGSHNPEFTMIEWYRADADYTAIMRDTEELVAAAAGTERLSFGGREINLATPWCRLTCAQAFAEYADIDLSKGIDDPAWFRTEADRRGYGITDADNFDDVFFKIFLRDIEPKLGLDAPVILCEYPASMAALSRLKPGDHRFAERFEAYVAGLELCNAFSELNDALEQRRRLEEERELRRKLGKPVYDIDEQFIEAVGKMPKSAGIALGVDRLVMLLTDAPSIEDVLFFPARDILN
jgi:lysyl-tRNA synthetase class 2